MVKNRFGTGAHLSVVRLGIHHFSTGLLSQQKCCSTLLACVQPLKTLVTKNSQVLCHHCPATHATVTNVTVVDRGVAEMPGPELQYGQSQQA